MQAKGENDYKKNLTLLARFAAEQRVVAHMYFLINEYRFINLMGQCVTIKDDCLIIRIAKTEIDQTKIHIGTDVHVYFTINRETEYFCYFTTRLIQVYDDKKNYIYLFFAIPKSVQEGKSRSSMRVDIDDSKQSVFTVWRGEITPVYEKLLPKLSWRDLKQDSCTMVDLSTNGMCIQFPAVYDGKLDINDLMLLRMAFHKKEIYALGVVVRKIPLPGMAGFGCKFYAWCKSIATGKNNWFPVTKEDGIAGISEWISTCNISNVKK